MPSFIMKGSLPNLFFADVFNINVDVARPAAAAPLYEALKGAEGK